MTKLSVIIPTFGRAPSLKRTIESLLEQSIKPFEILVIDQNSPGWLVMNWGVAILRPAYPFRDANASRARNLGYLLSEGDTFVHR